jgi:asparagine synthase (glutamine-hydrolysing)
MAHRWANTYQKIPGALRRGMERCVAGLPGFRGTALKGSVRLAKKMLKSASLEPQERFIRNCTYLDADQKKSLYCAEVHHQLAEINPADRHHAHFDVVREADFLNQMLYLDTKIFMVSLNLNYNDKMSMASSVEVRLPFLDRELAEFAAWNISPNLKLKGWLQPTTKHIFRRAMEDVLPAEVLRQPKAGFAAPVDYWLANDLREMVDDLLSETSIRERGLLRPEVVRRFVDEHRSGSADWSMQIWQFLALENWMRVFLDAGVQQRTDEFSQAREAATA